MIIHNGAIDDGFDSFNLEAKKQTRKDAGAIDDIFHSFSLDTQETIKDFLEHYAEGSRVQYRSSVVNMLNDLNQKDISKLTYKDYEPIKEKYESGGKTSWDSYRMGFFQYIYCFDKLENNSGFILDKDFHKDKGIKHFKKSLKDHRKEESTNNKSQEYEQALNFNQLGFINDLINMECNTDNMDKYKISFILYMIYETDYSIDNLKYYLKASNFKKGIIKNKKGREFIIPERYWDLMEEMNNNKTMGFTTTLEIIRDLGNEIGIEDLTPRKIRDSRKKNIIQCPNCGVGHLNSINNWTAINDRIVCMNCAEVLKKTLLKEKRQK